MLSDAQEVKELQALGIGETTARHREVLAPAVDENARKAMEEAQDVARKADFSDLRGSADGGLFTIDKTEERGLLLEQLRKVYAHIERRLASDRYWRSKPPGSKPRPITDPKAVTLYDAAKYVIKPATVQAQCSMVELMATASQLPKWFVSHWWGEAVADFLACLTAHATSRLFEQKHVSHMLGTCWPIDAALDRKGVATQVELLDHLVILQCLTYSSGALLTQSVIANPNFRQRRIALQRIGDGFDALGGVGAFTSVGVDATKRVA